MVVLKFGGTSVGNAAMMDQTLDIVSKELAHAPMLVSSAVTKVTDALVHIADLATKHEPQEVVAAVTNLKDLHLKIARELIKKPEACVAELEASFTELMSLAKGLCLIKEVSPRSKDALVSFGERLSTKILYHRALERGISASYLDARSCVKTDENFTSANLLKSETYAEVKKVVKPRSNHLIITQGFIGSTKDGITTTLGRGGSDYSATIFGAALGVAEVQIWTDVDGIMTTDPRIVPTAKVIDEISYSEAAELSYFGAKVIHPSTIMPAVELGIPVWVKNTKNPSAIGTKIHTHSKYKGVQAIAGKKGVALITVKSSRMLNAHGFLKSLFTIFEEHRVSVDLIATSEVSVSVTIDDTRHLKSLKRDLSHIGEVEILEDRAIVCLVGKDLWKQGEFLTKTFKALDGIDILLITLGGSDINLSLVVSGNQLTDSIVRLHRALFE